MRPPDGFVIAAIAAAIGRDLQRAVRMAGGPAAFVRLSDAALVRRLGLDPDAAARVRAARRAVTSRQKAPDSRDAGESRYLEAGGTGYPTSLSDLPDPPFGLFATGDWESVRETLDVAPRIAIVGSRSSSAAGMAFAERLAKQLASLGAIVVSGLARGVDAAAHDGALAGGGLTIGVLGCGCDVVYPSGSGERYRRVAASGVILSEYWPGTRPAPWRFPARNRIVAGLAHAVVVVEAAGRSGALITADFGLELGRSVLAVPGLAGSPRVEGCHALIRSGAALCERVEDVLDELPSFRWEAPVEVGPPDGGRARATLAVLADAPLTPDEVAERLGVGVPEAAGLIALLEVDGFLVSEGGRYRTAPR
jgi:DNA processing protein